MRNWKLSALAGVVLLSAAAAAQAQTLSPRQALGKKLFFDTGLSANGSQSCAACHAPEVGFTGPDSATNGAGSVYQGAIPNHYGNRRPPTAAYAGESPLLHQDASGQWIGGMFWDGRATGSVLGDPLAEQAQGPYLNPLEQALANAWALCAKVDESEYAGLFEQVWGAGSLDCARNADSVYAQIGRSVADYERSREVSPFSSKFDQFWDRARSAGKDVTRISCGSGGGMGGAMGCGGGGSDPNRWTAFRGLGLTDSELLGLAAFNDSRSANCASCHSLKPGISGYPLFTDFSYDNLGIPRNPDNPFYSMPKEWNPEGKKWIDYGLGGYLKGAGKPDTIYGPQLGKFKVPTLRNVDLRPTAYTVKAYGHNGYFKSLEEIVFFYHWRGMMDSGCMGTGGMGGGGMGGGGMGNCSAMAGMFPPPEVDQNRAQLGMFPRPLISSIVAFLKTLSDGYYLK